MVGALDQHFSYLRHVHQDKRQSSVMAQNPVAVSLTDEGRLFHSMMK